MNAGKLVGAEATDHLDFTSKIHRTEPANGFDGIGIFEPNVQKKQVRLSGRHCSQKVIEPQKAAKGDPAASKDAADDLVYRWIVVKHVAGK